MSPKAPSNPSESSSPKRGGWFSQFLELFGMTPTIPSEYLSAGPHEEQQRPQERWLCQSCHNPARWDESESRWRCHYHPKASVFEQR